MHSPIARASRLIEFARHMPMRKIARRLELDLKRRIGDRFGQRLPAASFQAGLAPTPPMPIFAPRRTTVRAQDGRLSFTFLNRTVEMPDGRIDWNMPSRAPADQLWRMNLHYMEYLEGADDVTWAQLAADWLAANGAPKPGAWRDSWNSYALSIRVVVWLQELARRRGHIATELARKLEDSALEQIRFLGRNIETDLGGNHLVKNIKALVWGSGYYTGPEADGWRKRGLALLESAIDEQILADGVHYERSPSYHAQVFADLLECRVALGRDPLGGRLDTVLAAMAQVIADLAHPDGSPALFNDAGLGMAYVPADCLDAFAAVNTAAVRPRAVFAYPAAGYFGVRSPTTYFVADCGRIAPDDLPAHGHGDVLSFEWSVMGRRMIVDQGVYEYVAGDRRARSRSCASHNTLSLGDGDQAQFFGAFRCGRRPNVTVRICDTAADRLVLEGCHDGFANLAGHPVHVRRFEAAGDTLVIHDRVEGATEHPASIAFLLHPDCRVVIADKKAQITHGDALAELSCEAPVRTEAAVWWPDMGVEIPTTRLKVDLPPHARAHVSRLEVLG